MLACSIMCSIYDVEDRVEYCRPCANVTRQQSLSVVRSWRSIDMDGLYDGVCPYFGKPFFIVVLLACVLCLQLSPMYFLCMRSTPCVVDIIDFIHILIFVLRCLHCKLACQVLLVYLCTSEFLANIMELFIFVLYHLIALAF